MKNLTKCFVFFAILVFFACTVFTGCGGSGGGNSGQPLAVEEVDPEDVPNNGGGNGGGGNGGGSGDNGQNIPGTGDGTLHPIFQGKLGVPISRSSMGIIDPDPTGHNPCTDFDGDGLSNGEEITSNPFIADYPQIVTRVSAPITMEIRVNESDSSKNYSETLSEEDIRDTRISCMDENHYQQANLKTTPVIVKKTDSVNDITQQEFSIAGTTQKQQIGYETHYNPGYPGYTTTVPVVLDEAGDSYVNTGYGDIYLEKGKAVEFSTGAMKDFSESHSTEDTDFRNVNYVDNLDRHGSSLNQESAYTMAKNYKTSDVIASMTEVGPNAGIVRASLFIKNATVNIPARVSNILCTLTFKTPAGEFLPIKTFRLRNEDWSEYEQDIYGGEEFGPFTIEIPNLNTHEIRTALRNGYMPQIQVISYELSRVYDSNYNPGVDNLKIVEETAKGRTAMIKIIGPGVREMYRVPAFDVESDGRISPGISLKKALFNIFKDRIGFGESWTSDSSATIYPSLYADPQDLTVSDADLKWKPTGDRISHYTHANQLNGNSWTMFETYIKKYTDAYNVEHYIETIKRIGSLAKYNPFDKEDNPSYNPNDLLTKNEFFKMRYWYIYHNGRYFEGDINDPIWAGERYEIICMDMGEFNTHFETFSYTPLQAESVVRLTTLWNEQSKKGPFARAVYLGKAVKGDAIHFELDLSGNRMLFDPAAFGSGLAFGEPYQEFTGTDSYAIDQGFAWFNYNYTFSDDNETAQGIPQEFCHKAYGRTNSILVDIDESEFALEYDVRITNSGSFDKTVRVSRNELEKNGGLVAVNRKTIDITENPVGVINEGTYNVRVTARGIAYGVPVSKASLSGSVSVDVVSVAGALPGYFTYTATAMSNRINFQISDADNAEYFLIRYIGPQNPGYGSSSEKIVYAHTGYNQIDIENPVSKPVDPGVYEVHVYSVINGNEDLAECTESGSGEYILVNYERYNDEKSLAPKLSTDYFDQRAIDLEVNFNDGSGWYRLKLSFAQAGDDGRTINCLATNYVEYDKQKFHIFFQPPIGDDHCPYNVFSGGREEVDVYVRTVAKPEYRYTVWPRKNDSLCNLLEDADRYVYTNAVSVDDFPGGDVVQYWMENAETDSANYEDMLRDKIYSSVSDLAAVNLGDFAVVPDQESSPDYFFAPALYRKYGIKASITDKINVVISPIVEAPSFTVAPGDNRSLIVSEFDSTNAEYFEVYFRAGERESDTPNLYASPWHSAGITIVSPDQSYEITNLTVNALYTVAAIAYNEDGNQSEPAFLTATTQTNVPPEAPEGVLAEDGGDGYSILVSNIYVNSVSNYTVYWRPVGDTAWTGTMSIANQYGPASCTLTTGIDRFHEYEIRVRSYLNGLYSEFSDPVHVDMRIAVGPDAYESYDTSYVFEMIIGQTLVRTFHNGSDVDWIYSSIDCAGGGIGGNPVVPRTIIIETLDAASNLPNVKNTWITVYRTDMMGVHRASDVDEYDLIAVDFNSGEGDYAKIEYTFNGDTGILIKVQPFDSSCTGYYRIAISAQN